MSTAKEVAKIEAENEKLKKKIKELERFKKIKIEDVKQIDMESIAFRYGHVAGASLYEAGRREFTVVLETFEGNTFTFATHNMKHINVKELQKKYEHVKKLEDELNEAEDTANNEKANREEIEKNVKGLEEALSALGYEPKKDCDDCDQYSDY